MFYTGSQTVRTRRHHPMPQLPERHLRRHHNLSRRQWQTSFIKPFWILRNYSGEPWLEHPVRMSLRCLWGQILRIRSDMDWNWMKEWSKRQSRTILPWVPRIHLAAKELYFQGNRESLTMLYFKLNYWFIWKWTPVFFILEVHVGWKYSILRL